MNPGNWSIYVSPGGTRETILGQRCAARRRSVSQPTPSPQPKCIRPIWPSRGCATQLPNSAHFISMGLPQVPICSDTSMPSLKRGSIDHLRSHFPNPRSPITAQGWGLPYGYWKVDLANRTRVYRYSPLTIVQHHQLTKRPVLLMIMMPLSTLHPFTPYHICMIVAGCLHAVRCNDQLLCWQMELIVRNFPSGLRTHKTDRPSWSALELPWLRSPISSFRRLSLWTHEYPCPGHRDRSSGPFVRMLKCKTRADGRILTECLPSDVTLPG